jgi:aspartyl-tRNA(Asn)/glutamyl-tRNA(Gln) amidotransferase subunit C
MNITKQELLKVAELSLLKLDHSEATLFADQIKTILDYADQLQQVPLTMEVETVGNVNVFREDISIPCETTDEILKQAPQTCERYFVVPKILE